MTLLEDYGLPSAPSELNSIEWLWSELTRNGKPPADAVTWHVVEHALALADQGRIDLAEACVIEMSQRFDMTLEHYFAICMRLYQKNQAFSSTKIFAYYLRNGGVQRDAFEFEIFRHYQQENFDRAIATFKDSQKWSSWQTISPHILFLVANSFMLRQRLDECFAIISFLVDTYPKEETFRNNVTYLALNLKYQPARDYFTDSINEISRSFKVPPFGDHSGNTPYIIDLATDDQIKIIASLYQHGLCHIKNAIDIAIAKDILDHLLENEGSLNYPIGFNSYIMERCASLLRFDALSIVNTLLPTPGALDEKHSVVRKVDPGAAHSFTPFHQDATAFHKALVNIWTPLTPAGGDYPTIELVKRRLTFAEATMETSDNYSLVKIDDAQILKKYQDDLYEATDVAPGECIIFLGTTIHRSTNLQAATKTRYNMEIRWS